MKKLLCSLTIFILTFSGLALALIAPQSKEMLEDNASLILIGKVVSVENFDETKPYGIDSIYTVTMSVDGSEKGENPSTNTIKFTFWKAKKREKGWAGDYGQTEIIKPKMIIRAYLTKTPEGEYKLLEPNGWEKI